MYSTHKSRVVFPHLSARTCCSSSRAKFTCWGANRSVSSSSRYETPSSMLFSRMVSADKDLTPLSFLGILNVSDCTRTPSEVFSLVTQAYACHLEPLRGSKCALGNFRRSVENLVWLSFYLYS